MDESKSLGQIAYEKWCERETGLQFQWWVLSIERQARWEDIAQVVIERYDSTPSPQAAH